jgi:hypothetical protein
MNDLQDQAEGEVLIDDYRLYECFVLCLDALFRVSLLAPIGYYLSPGKILILCCPTVSN